MLQPLLAPGFPGQQHSPPPSSPGALPFPFLTAVSKAKQDAQTSSSITSKVPASCELCSYKPPALPMPLRFANPRLPGPAQD